MANQLYQTYVPSQCIHIFPCATRTYENNTASKFLTQYNLTHFVGGGQSCNLTKAGDLYMRFSVNGYFVQIDYQTLDEETGIYQKQTWWENFFAPDSDAEQAKPKSGQILYAYIKLAAPGKQIGEFADTANVNTQSALASFIANEKLDKSSADTSIFTGLKLVFRSADDTSILNNSVKLATVNNDGTLQWQPTLIQAADIADEVITTDKLAPNAVTEDKLGSDINNILSHIGQLYIGEKWYTVSVSDGGKTLEITEVTDQPTS